MSSNAIPQYKDRLSAEINNYQRALEQGGLANSIPKIFSYWAGKYLSPRLKRIYGHTNINEIFASELIANSKKANCPKFRILSLGSGDCRTEVEIARLLARDGMQFTFVCTDVNETVIAKANTICRDSGLEQNFEHLCVDLNVDFPDIGFDAVIANHSLHHFVGLENIFNNIKKRLRIGGVFVINDMIGRNGHMRWPEALIFVEQIWNFLPREKKFNNHAKCYEDWPYVNFDCTSGGDFEGVRAQDILPILLDNFFISKFVSFGNIPDVFIDRAYGPNFSPDDEDDCRLIDYLDSLNTHLIDMGIIKPTMMIATLQHSGNNCLFEKWSPSFSVRKY
jgi:SAM-dependent methyltransferase